MKDVPEELWHDSYRRRAFRRVMDGTPTERRGGAPSGYKRLVGDLNSLTITSACTREFIHPREDRPLTLREAARLQSFPDRFRFLGTTTSVARQIGNAFPPIIAQIFAEHLLRTVENLDAKLSTRHGTGRLLGFHLTEGTGMSPALAKTDEMLAQLLHKQDSFNFDLGTRSERKVVYGA
jgi:DNA (cytosine-5)-methyltransferase 1